MSELEQQNKQENIEQQKGWLPIEEISPNWACRIQNRETKYWSLGGLIMHSKYCVVGEAYGYSDDYTNHCPDCKHFSEQFCMTDYLNQTTEEFVNHWNEVHVE